MNQIAKLALLSAVLGILAVVNVHMSREPLATTPVLTGVRSPAQLPAGDGGSGEGDESSQTTLTFVQSFSRPLFNEDRRKYQPPQKKPEPKGKKVAKDTNLPPPPVKLIGVSVSQGSSRALIVNTENDSTIWLAIGDSISDWEAVSIDPNTLVLKNGDRTVNLNLHPDES